jgi:hypothetical protein
MSAVLLGIFFAIFASASNNFGIVLQKKVVDAVPPESREQDFFKSISRQPLWLLGLFLQLGLPTGFLLVAQYLIGPTLVPGLQGIGLILLVIGSVKLNNESLTPREYIGILLLIIATGLVGFSGLNIEVSAFDFQQSWFFRNTVVFTTVVLSGSLLLEIGQRRSDQFRKGLYLTILTGFLYVLSDFWTSSLVGTIGPVFELKANWTQWALFLIACVLLVSTNIVAIGKTQTTFKYGPASILIPIRCIPTLVSPIFVYYFVFNQVAPGSYSLWFFLTGILLVFTGSVLLGRREAGFTADDLAVDAQLQ